MIPYMGTLISLELNVVVVTETGESWEGGLGKVA